MFLNQTSRVVGTFPTIETAGKGLDQLVLAGFPLANVFLVGKNLADCHQNGKNIQGGVQLVDYAQAGAIAGTALGLTKGLVAGNLAGGITGILLGLGMMTLPGAGQIAFTSAVVFTLISGGVCTAAGGVIGALIGLGLTENQAREFSNQVKQGNYLLVVTGTVQEIESAERILSAQRIHH